MVTKFEAEIKCNYEKCIEFDCPLFGGLPEILGRPIQRAFSELSGDDAYGSRGGKQKCTTLTYHVDGTTVIDNHSLKGHGNENCLYTLKAEGPDAEKIAKKVEERIRSEEKLEIIE